MDGPKLPKFHMLKRPLFYTVIIALLFISCDSDIRQADISAIEQQVQFLNLHDRLAQTDFTQQDEEYQRLYQSFGSFWTNYTEDILRIGSGRESRTLSQIQQFLDYPDIKTSGEGIDEIYQNTLTNYTEEIDLGFRRYRYFFPNDSLPDVVFMNSGHNFAVFPTNEHLGIGLEFFLGKDHFVSSTLDPQVFPQYMRNKMEPRLMVPDALRGWLLVRFQDDYYHDENLISNLMYWGKVMYLLELMLPEEEKQNLMDYSKEELAWCEGHERSLWVEFSQQDVLYETRRFEVNRWIVDGPFTRVDGLPQETPARIGVWIAWQITKDYMKRNPDKTIQQLFEDENYLAMLNAYRPN